MGKKRKGSARTVETDAPTGWEDRGGKMGPIKTYEDVADSEDEFHINRDKVLLEDGPDTKRRKKWQEEDELLEPSDEEVLGYSDSEEEDEDTEDHAGANQNGNAGSSDEDESEVEDEEEEGWGASKKDYYNADNIETEVDAREEEEEAKRIQQKRLQKMSEADFGFDESEWLDTAQDEDNDGDVITEVLKDVEITSDMGPEERLRILRTKYPEFEFLADEFLRLQPVLVDLQQQADAESSSKIGVSSTTIVRCRALAAYVASLSMYFAILTSPVQSSNSTKTMDPDELRDHPVMDSLLQCRELWSKVKNLKASQPVEPASDEESLAEEDPTPIIQNGASEPKESKKQKASNKAASAAAAERAERIQRAEEELADLSELVPKSRKSKKSSQPIIFRDDDSDFGEETHLSSRAAAEKAQKKKSLRFYTSQIAQKANKRADAGRDAGGDMDLPQKERFRDRQARLNAEAEKRGKKLDEYGRGTALGGDSGDEDTAAAQGVRGEEDEYYDLVAQTSKKRKQDKDDKYAAIQQAKAANGLVRVVEGEVDEDGKRAIGYVIEKNKGLAPKRKKDVRNPRVKKRKKFEEKKKKLASMKAVYKGGEERGGYGGEKTGIKTGLVKSIKL